MNKEPSELGKLARRSLANSDRWFGDDPHTHNLTMLMLGLVGEIGDVADLFKKVNTGNIQIKDASIRFQLGMELADVFVYWLNICAVFGFDPQELYNMKEQENNRRFAREQEERYRVVQSTIVDGVNIVRQ